MRSGRDGRSEKFGYFLGYQVHWIIVLIRNTASELTNLYGFLKPFPFKF